MSDTYTLLSTKLFVPKPRANLVVREQLYRDLDNALTHKLTLVAAPAGFGKTTLVSAWLTHKGRQAAWLSLDEHDNDPLRFLHHLGAALAQVGLEVTELLEPLRQGGQALVPEGIIAGLLNCIARQQQTVVLVLDDYHVISEAAVHRAVGFLLEHLPETLCVVMTSRSDPPLALARLRANRQLLEVRAEALRFTPEETASFCREMKLALSHEAVTLLSTRTEGWVAGLQLAALSLQDEPDTLAFIRSFAGNHRYIMDYLVDEVFARQPRALQDFLLRTAVLERLCAPLCAAVLGNSVTENQLLLERLEADNLFVIPLDNKRYWYRYHHLFGDLLCHKLHLSYPSEVQSLRRRAASWFEQHGQYAEALRHLLIAEDMERAAALLVTVGPVTLWQRGAVATVMRWLAKLPEHVLNSYPSLLILCAWTKHLTGDSGAIEPLLKRAEAQSLPETLQVEITALRAFVARMRGELSEAAQLAQTALTALPDDAVQLRGIVTSGLAEICLLMGDHEAAQPLFEVASVLCETAGSILPALFSLWRLAEVQMISARLSDAWATSERMHALAERSHTHVGFTEVIQGRLLCEWNDLGAAEAKLRRGIELGKQLNYPRVPMMGYATLARVLQARQQSEAAQAVLAEAAQFAAAHGVTWTWGLEPIAPYQARVALMTGYTEPAERWIAAQGLKLTGEISLAQETAYVTLLRILIAKAQWADAETLLARLVAYATASRRHYRVLELSALQALLVFKQGQQARACQLITAVLERAEAEGYVRLFADEGQSMAALLRAVQTRGERRSYLNHLLHAVAAESLPEAEPLMVTELAETFNPRELAVLRLLAVRLTNKEIASELGLTVNTVKWYARGLYNKLGVHGRKSAVAKARQLGIL